MSEITIQNKTTCPNGARNGENGTGLVFKILKVTVHKWQKEMVNIIPNKPYTSFMELGKNWRSPKHYQILHNVI
jgi:hypothetical protein